jgi:hypothetical protein
LYQQNTDGDRILSRIKFICCWKLLHHWLFTSDVVMEASANSGLNFIGM